MAAVEDNLTEEQLAQIAAMREAQEEETGDQQEETGDVGEDGAPGDQPDRDAPAELEGAAKQAAVRKQIETKAANYKKGMIQLLEQSDETWFESPFDIIPGFVQPFDSESPDAFAMRAAADAYFEQGTKRYRPHPTKVTCPECDGYGKLDSGAKGECTPWAVCWACNGSGSRDLTMPAPTPPSQFGQIQAPPPTAAVPPWQPPAPLGPTEVLAAPQNWYGQGKPGADHWGRWPGHPRYGIDPDINGGVW